MPEASRRAVLTAAGVGVAVAALAPGGAAAAAGTGLPPRSAWTAVRGKRVFLRSTSGARVQALVREIADLRHATAGDPRRYSVFVVPERPLDDGTYRLVGTTGALYFVNVGPKGEALQAVVDAAPA